jgi:predicted Fe-S protein YdhL (DUF1289 family)
MSERDVESPCIDICRINQTTGWCDGCLRTLHEISVWSRLPPEGKRLVLQQIELRRAERGVDGTGPSR